MRYMDIEKGLEEKVNNLVDRAKSSLSGSWEIEYIKLSRDEVILRMPVNDKTRQPFGLLHGGASVALAESAASIGAWLNVDEKKYMAVALATLSPPLVRFIEEAVRTSGISI
jgi:1,4-dihydroxy-2-naphthoyl-CoA hydrolase